MACYFLISLERIDNVFNVGPQIREVVAGIPSQKKHKKYCKYWKDTDLPFHT
jgi:hypothetical protein